MHIRKWNETRGAVVAPAFPASVSVAARTTAGLLAAALVLLLGAGSVVAQTDTTPPTLVKVEYEGATVWLTFSEALDEAVVPATGNTSECKSGADYTGVPKLKVRRR